MVYYNIKHSTFNIIKGFLCIFCNIINVIFFYNMQMIKIFYRKRVITLKTFADFLFIVGVGVAFIILPIGFILSGILIGIGIIPSIVSANLGIYFFLAFFGFLSIGALGATIGSKML